jgi:hypothetical protein
MRVSQNGHLLVHALVEEGERRVGLGHEGPFFDELGEHLRLHEHPVKLVVIAVPRAQEALK